MEVFYQGAECDIHVQFVIKWAIPSGSAEQKQGAFAHAQEGILFHDAEVVDLAGAFQNEAAQCAGLRAFVRRGKPDAARRGLREPSRTPIGLHESE